MRHDTTRHTTRRDTTRHDTRHDTTRHHAKWHDATRHDTTLHDTAQYDLRVLHTSRLGIKLTACPSASCFKGAESTHARNLHRTLSAQMSVSDCHQSAKGGAPRGPVLPPAAGLPLTGGRACASAHGDTLSPREAGAYVSPPVLDAIVVPAPSPEGGGSLGAPGPTPVANSLCGLPLASPRRCFFWVI